MNFNANLSQSISQHSSQKTFPLTRHCTEKDTMLVKLSSDREKLLKVEAEGRGFAKFLRSLEQFIQTVKG